MRLNKKRIKTRSKKRSVAKKINKYVDIFLKMMLRYLHATLLKLWIGFITGRNPNKMLRSKIPKSDVSHIMEGVWTVNSQSRRGIMYVVEEDGTCNCPVGLGGSACKHVQAVAFHHRVAFPHCLPATAEQRSLLYEIATGMYVSY